MTSLNGRVKKDNEGGIATVARQPRPLYRRIADTMRSRIANGEWGAGETLPSRVQLCDEFQTTRVTLDKAIAGLIREGLLRASKGSGTFVADLNGTSPSSSARNLRVGVVLGQSAPRTDLDAPGVENHYYGPLFQGVRDAFAAQGVEAIYTHLEPAGYGSFCADAGLDGMILTSPLLTELDNLHQLTGEGIIYVAASMSSHTAADSDLPCVDSDNVQGAYDAVGHLLALGHRHIGIVNLATSQANHHDRLEGYKRALSDSGLLTRLGDLLLYPIHDEPRMEERIEEWLRQSEAQGDLPTALFCCDYLMTLATLRVLRRRELRVPEDISVVGFDDPFSAAHLTPALTTVRQPVYQIGRRAAERLLDGLRSGIPPRGAEFLPTQLIVRDSARPPVSHSSLEKEGIPT